MKERIIQRYKAGERKRYRALVIRFKREDMEEKERRARI